MAWNDMSALDRALSVTLVSLWVLVLVMSARQLLRGRR